MLAHSVYFTLVDNSAEAKNRLIEACKKHLAGHPGTAWFSVGRMAEDIDWDASDRDFDVALQLVFRDRASLDAYLDSARHARFMEENESAWSKIRSFDAYVET